MRTNPKTDDELALINLMPEGTYEFMIISAKSHFAKDTNNESIKIVVKFWDNNQVERTWTDYLTPLFAVKLKRFCKATDLLSQYESDNLSPEDIMNKTAYLKMIIKKGKDKNGNMIDRNEIADYLKESDNEAMKIEPSKKTEIDAYFNDEIKF